MEAPDSELAMPTLVARASGEQRFPKFLKLPTEIQLMIWAAWRADQPPIRHYFCLEGLGRGYAAFDPTQECCVETTAKTAESNKHDPLDPMEYKIRFTNAVGIAPEGLTMGIKQILDGHTLSAQLRLNPAFAWVNFHKDVFIIENTSHRYPGVLRFVFRNIGAKMPPAISPEHWASRIQTLALHISTLSKAVLSHPLDRAALAKMISLRTVLLIVKNITVSRAWNMHGENTYGFMEIIEPRLCVAGFSLPFAKLKKDFTTCQAIMCQVQELLAECGRSNVKVTLVTDPFNSRQFWIM